jgi:hypothetical protein
MLNAKAKELRKPIEKFVDGIKTELGYIREINEKANGVKKVNYMINVGKFCEPIRLNHKQNLKGKQDIQGEYNLAKIKDYVDYLKESKVIPFGSTQLNYYIKLFLCKDAFLGLTDKDIYDNDLYVLKIASKYCNFVLETKTLTMSETANKGNLKKWLTNKTKKTKDTKTLSDARKKRTTKLKIEDPNDAKNNLNISFDNVKNSDEDILERFIAYFGVEKFVDYLSSNGYTVTKKEETKEEQKKKRAVEEKQETLEAVGA